MNNKGIIFSLDGAIAVTIVLIMLINTTYYFTTTSQESLSQTQVIRRGYDTLAMFDYENRLQDGLSVITPGQLTLKDVEIGVGSDFGNMNVTAYLPPGYGMRIELADAQKTACQETVPEPCDIFLGQPTKTITTEPIINGGEHYVQVNALGGSPLPSVQGPSVNGIQTTASCTSPTEVCTYTTLTPITFAGGGTPEILTVGAGIVPFTVNWIKVLDDPSYSLFTTAELPTDRFIGSGERWYAAHDPGTNHFEGFHRARFTVWLI